jgi:hypothetical protein
MNICVDGLPVVSARPAGRRRTGNFRGLRDAAEGSRGFAISRPRWQHHSHCMSSSERNLSRSVDQELDVEQADDF